MQPRQAFASSSVWFTIYTIWRKLQSITRLLPDIRWLALKWPVGCRSHIWCTRDSRFHSLRRRSPLLPKAGLCRDSPYGRAPSISLGRPQWPGNESEWSSGLPSTRILSTPLHSPNITYSRLGLGTIIQVLETEKSNERGDYLLT